MVIAAFHLGLTPIERPGTDSFKPRKIIFYGISYTSSCSGRKKKPKTNCEETLKYVWCVILSQPALLIMEELRVSQSNQIKSNQNYFCHQEEHEQCNDIHTSLKTVTQTQTQTNIHKIIDLTGVSCWEAESRWKRSQLMSLSFCGESDLYLHADGKRVENSCLCTSDSRTISQINNLYSTYAPVWNQASHTDKVVCRAVHANFRSPPIKLFFSFFFAI